ncbi:MAG: VWA domain-containing protein [Flavobacteriaceae bacterium]|nr:MAG: VWA domain-containing protein [Flavobacteriaceae bacterium]
MNPTIKHTEIIDTKPRLAVLADNSESVAYFKEEEQVNTILNDFKNHTQLNNKFTASYFSFGNRFKKLDSITYSETQTNINEAITSVHSIFEDTVGAVVLITDGNQTYGNDYEFSNSPKPIYPIVIGDTTKHTDLKISRLHVNRYSYLNNRFPIESLLYYEGEETVSSVFTISTNGKRVFSKRLTFSDTKRTATIQTSLLSLKKGKNYYTASIQKIKGEKNTANNSKTFAIEVIDEQTKVLIITSVLHPDVGALKKSIETNKQRKADIKVIGKETFNIENYQLVLLYQPNTKFNTVFDAIKKNKAHYFIVTGTKTDWSFLNRQQLGVRKNIISKSENYSAGYNANFLTFSQDDIGFSQFPPLTDAFGENIFSKAYEPLLFQNIKGIAFDTPLLATIEEGEQKSAILFGEGIWKWRAASYLNSTTFEVFDHFISNLIQYVTSTKIRKRLDVTVDDLFPANAPIAVTALYLDKNYRFDSRVSLSMEITNSDQSIQRGLPFSVVGNSYQLQIENLPAGDYLYTVKVKDQEITASGNFKITTFKIEEQFTNANTDKLYKIADKTGGKSYYKTAWRSLIQDLLDDSRFYTTQKAVTKNKHFIDWEWLLVLLVILLSGEWFIRKYYGKI